MSSSTARTIGSVFHKASISSTLFSFISLPKPYDLNSFLRRSSPSRLSPMVGPAQSRRRICTTIPVLMGRRSCKIAGRKDAQNLKKMKRNSRIGKEIVSASGGSQHFVFPTKVVEHGTSFWRLS